MEPAVDSLPTPPAEKRRLFGHWARCSPECRSARPAQDAVAPAAAALPVPLTAPADAGAGPPGDTLTPQNLLQLEDQVKTAPSTNLNGNPDTLTTDTLKLRGDLSVNLSPQWQIVFRGDLPALGKNPSKDRNPDGGFIDGVGDSDLQAMLIHALDSRWKVGGGVGVNAPTGGDEFGSGKWQAEPVAAFRYTLPEVSAGSYFEPLARWDVSFAGDPTRKAINNVQFAPLVDFALPDRWFFTLYPGADIRWNFGDPVTGQTGRLFLPFDARIGKALSERFNISLEGGVPIVKQYPVYNFMTALRFNLTF